MPSEVVCEAFHLKKRYAGAVTFALDDVSFSIPRRGLVGVLGPNGAGKTTLLDILEGLADPTGGTYRLFGAEPRPYPRRKVGVVMQREFVLDGITAAEYAELFAAIYGVRDGEAKILLGAGLAARARVAVERLSGGEAQRLFLAAATVHEPELVFLDEPTAHLDPESKLVIGEALRAMATERAVVLTTHDLHEADALCDTLLFLVGGRLRAFGTREELVQPHDGDIEKAFFHFCGRTT